MYCRGGKDFRQLSIKLTSETHPSWKCSQRIQSALNSAPRLELSWLQRHKQPGSWTRTWFCSLVVLMIDCSCKSSWSFCNFFLGGLAQRVFALSYNSPIHQRESRLSSLGASLTDDNQGTSYSFPQVFLLTHNQLNKQFWFHALDVAFQYLSTGVSVTNQIGAIFACSTLYGQQVVHRQSNPK